MALTLSKSGMTTGQPITAASSYQCIDALTGDKAYNITISGSLSIVGPSTLTGALGVTGTISSSGNLYGTDLFLDNKSVLDSSGTTLNIANNGNNYDTIIIGRNNTSTQNISLRGPVTASSHISSSGTIEAVTLIGRKTGTTQNNSGGDVDIQMSTSSYLPGSVISITQTTGNNSVRFTLPTPEMGLEYTFLSAATSTGNGSTRFSSNGDDLLNGMALCDNNIEDINGTTFTYASGAFEKGTRLNCISDGIIWHITAFCLCDGNQVSTS